MNLDAGILDLLAEPGCRLEYGIVDTVSPLKVFVAGSATSTTCETLAGVAVGDFVAVLVKEGDRLVLGSIQPPNYTPVMFQNGWSNLGGNWETVGYSRSGTEVTVRGVCAGGAVGAFVPIFTLPAGHRPLTSSDRRVFACVSNGVMATVYVYEDGSVTLAGGSNASLSLEFSFSVAP